MANNPYQKMIKAIAGKHVAGAESDPNFFAQLPYLPNPDPILRRMDGGEAVFESILSDAVVRGELRSMRGIFRNLKYRLNVGAEGDARAEEARQLCMAWMQHLQPNEVSDWQDVMWQMMNGSLLRGFKVHELVWGRWRGYQVPVEVLDRRNGRFKFNYGGSLLLLSKGNSVNGDPTDPLQFVVSRHEASLENPYGVSLLAACFWPWTFKTGGWRYFVKYCERHGLPWPVARYPQGTQDEDIDALAQALQDMLENAYAVLPDGTGVELLEAKASGSALPQESLILLANKEIARALTGQSSVGDQGSVGSRAANETAFKRQEHIHQADRSIPTASFNRIFRLITQVNFGDDVAAPTIEFFNDDAAGIERAQVYEKAVELGADPSAEAFLEEMNIPKATGPADVLRLRSAASLAATSPDKAGSSFGMRFAAAADVVNDAAVAQEAAAVANEVVAQTVFEPALALLDRFEREGKSLAEFEAELGALVGTQDQEALREMAQSAVRLSYLQGVAHSAAQTRKVAV